MSEYTIVNMYDSENMAPKYGMPEGFEARFPKKALGCTTGAVSMQKVAPGERHPIGHRHNKQEELYVVVEGGGRVKLGDDVHDLKQWDVVRVPPATWRGFEAGPDGLTILAYGAPISDEPDGEIEQGWWSD